MNDIPGHATKVIEVKNLSLAYGKGKKKQFAVRGLSFDIEEGETVGFIGANGAGKSSTIKSIMGFIFPEAGEVKVFGHRAGDIEARRRIGFLPEVTLYYSFMKAREVLELYGGLDGLDKATLKQRIPQLLAQVGLEGQGETLLKNFSKGMQQRIGIAQAIIGDPDLLVFDELSSGLDPVGRYDLRQTLLDLKRRGKTIFFSSHELHEVEDLCDRIIVIHQGKKIADEKLGPLLDQLRLRSQQLGGSPITLEKYFLQLIRPEKIEGLDAASAA